MSDDNRRCQGPGCNFSIAHMRRQARYCSEACRLAAHKDRKRLALDDRTVSLAGGEGYFDAADATRGYLDNWKPQRKTQIMLGQIQSVLDEYEAQLPLTCRQIYYRMIAAFRRPKGKEFERSLYRVLDLARRAQMIPFGQIRDDGIAGGGYWFKGPEEQIDTWRLEAKHFARDVQQGQPVRIQVWCEAEGMLPQLRRVADPCSVPVYSCAGFNSLTAIRQIVESCVYDTDGPTVVLHLGDCDPSGYSIYQAIVEDAAEFLKRDRMYDTQEFHYDRIAITLDQIKRFALEVDAIRTEDSRSKIWIERGLTHKVEIEALPPDAIARLLREGIERRMDLGRVEQIRFVQRRQRTRLLMAMSDLQDNLKRRNASPPKWFLRAMNDHDA